MNLRRYEHPGKFEGGLIIDTHAYAASLNGCGETVGSEYGGDSYTSLDGPFTPQEGEEALNSDEVAFLARQVGAILYEDHGGFVTVDYYEDEEAYLIEWNRVVDAYDEPDGDEDQDDAPEGWGSIEAGEELPPPPSDPNSL